MKSLCLFCLIIFLHLNFQGQNILDKKLKRPLPDLAKVGYEQAGLNSDSIQHMITALREQKKFDFRSVVVIKDNQLVMEEYFNTYWRETIHDIRSAGKSITSLLVGIAIDQGLIKDVEQPLYEFFPEINKRKPISQAHKGIKLKHLLMMSSGLDADVNDINSPGNGLNWVAQDAWIEFALNLPMKFESGTKWVYNDVCAMLSGAIVQRVSGLSLEEFAAKYLFQPLGIREYYWFGNAKGITGGMGNLYISNLDFAKIGLLVLNQGRWQNKQIISEDWITQLSSKHMDISDVDPFADHYGYLWYIAMSKFNGGSYDYFFASGNGGNKLYIIPQENMVISIQSSAYGRGYGHGRSNYVFESIMRSLGTP